MGFVKEAISITRSVQLHKHLRLEPIYIFKIARQGLCVEILNIELKKFTIVNYKQDK